MVFFGLTHCYLILVLQPKKKDDFDEFEQMYQQISNKAEAKLSGGPKIQESTVPSKPKFSAASLGLKTYDVDDSAPPFQPSQPKMKQENEFSKVTSKPFGKPVRVTDRTTPDIGSESTDHYNMGGMSMGMNQQPVKKPSQPKLNNDPFENAD